jgi:hypothetical protein
MTSRWNPVTALADVASDRVPDPSGAYRDLLSKGAVAHFDVGEGFSMWGIFSYVEVDKAATDTTTFSSVTVPPGSPRILPLMADPPEHTL